MLAERQEDKGYVEEDERDDDEITNYFCIAMKTSTIPMCVSSSSICGQLLVHSVSSGRP
jgi:hypothetical protein